jgi:uridine phosphorylase
MFLTEFDNHEAVIEPGRIIAKNIEMPEICICLFSDTVVSDWVERYDAQIVDEIKSVCGNRPIYKLCVEGFIFALFVPLVGGPGAGGCLEELIAKGGKRFIFFGSCGVLDHDIVEGRIILPTAAIRDEGLSFHYVEPSDEIAIDDTLVQLAKDIFDELGLPYLTGKTWTTDAFFRETPGKMKQAKSMGAICVEMECASLAAVAEYRGVSFVQFLWSVDNLDAPEWDSRGLSTKGRSFSDICMIAAIEMGKRI